jgi:hypothetical protein
MEMNFWGKLAGLTAFLGAIATLYSALHPGPKSDQRPMPHSWTSNGFERPQPRRR